jgi:hypothetical protein
VCPADDEEVLSDATEDELDASEAVDDAAEATDSNAYRDYGEDQEVHNDGSDHEIDSNDKVDSNDDVVSNDEVDSDLSDPEGEDGDILNISPSFYKQNSSINKIVGG